VTLEGNAVVVGVDGSAADELALRWAVAEAGARNAELRVVCAYQWLVSSDPVATDELYADKQHSQRSAEEVITNALARTAGIDPAVVARGAAIDGNAVEVLLEEAARASLLVLGSRQLGTLGSYLLGSVSAAVAARAVRPVVVIRGPSGQPAEDPSVVVGVDGSYASQPLLEFGFDYASRHRTSLHAIFCWPPDLPATMMWRSEPHAPGRAEAWLSEALGGWQEKFPEVVVHSAVIRDHPTAGLISESLNQDLLIVGSHGQHAWTGTLLGSVSQGVLHHAYCPVAVVPSHTD